MSDIDKIRQEIERRIENYWSDGDVDSVVVSGELEELIDFIDSLPDNDSLDESKIASKDLEQAAARYERDNRQSVLASVDVVNAFIEGARWKEGR